MITSYKGSTPYFGFICTISVFSNRQKNESQNNLILTILSLELDLHFILIFVILSVLAYL